VTGPRRPATEGIKRVIVGHAVSQVCLRAAEERSKRMREVVRNRWAKVMIWRRNDNLRGADD
jgi:hypothetical protein